MENSSVFCFINPLLCNKFSFLFVAVIIGKFWRRELSVILLASWVGVDRCNVVGQHHDYKTWCWDVLFEIIIGMHE